MALETWTLEFRTDHNDPDKDKIVTELLRQHAKSILSTLMLLQDKRPPLASFMSSNMFEREKEIGLADDLPEGTLPSLTETQP